MIIEADPALGVPYGNYLQFPGVFGKWYLYVVQKGTFANWSWFNGMVPKNLQCVGICNRVMHRDLWSYLYSMKQGRSMNVAVSSVLTAAE